jgi:hypothetical protein
MIRLTRNIRGDFYVWVRPSSISAILGDMDAVCEVYVGPHVFEVSESAEEVILKMVSDDVDNDTNVAVARAIERKSKKL